MKGFLMNQDWKTIQIFLSEDSDSMYVCEVQLEASDPTKIRCTCGKTKGISLCKHIRYVKTNMAENNGNYAIRMSTSVTKAAQLKATESTEEFRKFIVQHTQSVVI